MLALLLAWLTWPASPTAAQEASAATDAGVAGAQDPGTALAPRDEAALELALPGAAVEGAPPALETGEESAPLKYLLERVDVEGNRSTKVRLIKKFVPLEVGEAFDVNDPEIEALRYRLLGTGWYDSVELRLKRGTRPGWVVLVIVVEERRTLVFQQLAAGVGWSVERAKSSGRHGTRTPEPYLGLSLADTNFLGTGKTVGGEVLVSPDQQGFALSYNDPVVRSSNWGFHTRGTFVNGQEYFGGAKDTRVSVDCSSPSGRPNEQCVSNRDAAVVDYWRTGLTLGTARDVGSFTRFTLDWHGDYVRVPSWGLPQAATQVRGRDLPDPLIRRAVDFAIEPANSFVSMFSVGFTYDKRDSAILPSRGTLASFLGDLASPLVGSTYEFVRLQTSVNQWVSTRWGHTVRLGAYAGAVFGNAPFFYKFFVSDLTDLQPSRILGLNLDHRPAPNLFGVLSGCKPFDASCGTAVAQMRQEELAARIDAEYVWPLVRGRRKFVKSADAYFLLGVYALADPRDLQLSIPGYSGLSRLPIDLTVDLGVRLDTQVGVFQIGVAKLMWLPFK